MDDWSETAVPPPSPNEMHEWIIRRPSRHHRCEAELPSRVSHKIDSGALWVCPGCRRRWRLMGRNSGDFAEGVSIVGLDGSTYWRAFRARFIGRLGT